MIELYTISLALLVPFLIGKQFHSDLNRFARLAFQALIFVTLLGPFYLAIKFMSPLGIAVYIGLPIGAVLIGRYDKSEWAFEAREVYRDDGWCKNGFYFVVLSVGLIYIIYQVYAATIMGPRQNSYWIFNVDNSQRLVHAWSIFLSTSFPAECIAPSLGGANPGTYYHVGSSALGAFFSFLFGSDPAAAYLRLAVPLLLIPAIIAPFILAYVRTRSFFLASIPIGLLLLPALVVKYVGHFRDIIYLNPKFIDLLWVDFYNLLAGIKKLFIRGDGDSLTSLLHITSTLGNPEVLNNGILDGTNVSILLGNALFMSAFFAFRRNTIGWFLLGLLPVLAMMNARLLFIVPVLIFVVMVSAVTARNTRLGLLILLCGIMLVPVLSSFFSGIDIGLTGTVYSIVFQKIGENRIPGSALIAALVIAVLCLGLHRLSSVRNLLAGSSEQSFLWIMLVTSFTAVVGLAGLQPLMGSGHWPLYSQELGKVLDQTMVVWGIFVFLFSTLFIPISSPIAKGRETFRRNVHGFSRLPHYVIFAGLFILISFRGYHLTSQLVKIVVWPEHGHEAANLSDHYECLKFVDDEAVLVTNNVSYPAGDHRRPVGYSTFLHLRGHSESSGFLSGVQLLSDPNASLSEIAKYFQSHTATHIFLVKRFPFSRALIDHITFQNDTCAIVPINKNWLRK